MELPEAEATAHRVTKRINERKAQVQKTKRGGWVKK
jgi:hypothetical protein